MIVEDFEQFWEQLEDEHLKGEIDEEKDTNHKYLKKYLVKLEDHKYLKKYLIKLEGESL